MTSVVFLWEEPDGKRCWEAVKEEQYTGFLVQLLNRGVHPATVMVAYAPILFRWVWKKFHKTYCTDKIYDLLQTHDFRRDPETPWAWRCVPKVKEG